VDTVLATFAVIFIAELPDKTALAASGGRGAGGREESTIGSPTPSRRPGWLECFLVIFVALFENARAARGSTARAEPGSAATSVTTAGPTMIVEAGGRRGRRP